MSSKAEHKLTSQAIFVTKNVLLVEPMLEQGYAHKFIARAPGAIGAFNGIGTCWWYTKRGLEAVENLATMLVESDKSFMGCDLDSAAGTIKNTLVETKPPYSNAKRTLTHKSLRMT